MCDVVIDGGNGENIASKVMVVKLGLTAKRHPHRTRSDGSSGARKHLLAKDAVSRFQSVNIILTHYFVMLLKGMLAILFWEGHGNMT